MRQPYRIESITLKDIGVFEHTHFDFPQITSPDKDAEKAEVHIFTGPNGCGKSTVLYALAAIFDAELMKKDLLKKRITSASNRIEYSFNQHTGLLVGEYPGQHKAQLDSVISDELRQYHHSSQALDAYKSASFAFSAFAYTGQKAELDLFHAYSVEELTGSPFADALNFEANSRTYLLAQWIATTIAKAALARSDGEHAEAASYDFALNRLKSFIKDVCDMSVDFRLNRKGFNVSLVVEGQNLDFDVLPEGFKSIFSWVADLVLRLETIIWKESRDIFSQPIILFLDEVDIHLHPKWQRRILPAIQKLLPNAQVFVSTHSPFVVGSVEDAYVYRLPEPAKDACRDPHAPEIIPVIESGAGKSYQLILAEVFDVVEEFDVETEQQLARFKILKQAYLKDPHDDVELMTLAQILSDKGEELSSLIGLELRQIARLLKNK
jgi:predicted ATP-binding protein involved in virulence